MDLTLPILVGVAALGYNFNLKKNKNKNNISKLNDNVLAHEKSNSKHIFNSNMINESQVKMNDQSVLQTLKSEKPLITNTINPVLFDYSCSSENNDSCGNLNNYSEEKKMLNGPLFNTNSDYLSEHVLVENYTDGQISDLTGLPMDLTHENMVPYTTLKGDYRVLDQNEYNSNRMHQLSGDVRPLSKDKDVTPIYQPHVDRSPYKMTYTQMIDQARFDTSTKISGVTSVEQTTVGKIPQQMIRIEPKNVDQLRSKIKPKMTYKGNINPGKGFTQAMTDIGEYDFKSRGKKVYNADTQLSGYSFKNKKGDIRPEQVLKNNKTDMPENSYGIAGIGNFASYLNVSDWFNSFSTQKKDSIHTNDSKNGMRNLKIPKGNIEQQNNNLDNTYLRTQERDTTIQNNYIGLPSALSKFGFTNKNDTLDTPKITNKEMNLLEYQGNKVYPINAPIDRESTFNNKGTNKVVPLQHFSNGKLATSGTTSDIGVFQLSNRMESVSHSGYKSFMGNQLDIKNIGQYSFNSSGKSQDMSSRNTTHHTLSPL